MGRHEQPIRGDNPIVVGFARRLRELRRAAGTPTYRQMARQAYASRTCLSAAASGGQLPTLNITEAFVRACGGDVAQWRALWAEAWTLTRQMETCSTAEHDNTTERELVGID
jgi:hypothetical protein